MKLQLPSPISDSLLLLVVQVVLKHVPGDWGSAIPFGIEALLFPSGLGLRHSPALPWGPDRNSSDAFGIPVLFSRISLLKQAFDGCAQKKPSTAC
jgi:hypothetical protein